MQLVFFPAPCFTVCIPCCKRLITVCVCKCVCVCVLYISSRLCALLIWKPSEICTRITTSRLSRNNKKFLVLVTMARYRKKNAVWGHIYSSMRSHVHSCEDIHVFCVKFCFLYLSLFLYVCVRVCVRARASLCWLLNETLDLNSYTNILRTNTLVAQGLIH